MFRRNVRWTFRRNTYAIDVPGFQGAEPSGKFRNSPKAGSGAEWLATLRNLPVISPPLNRHPPSHISTLRYQIKMEMTVVLWCRDRLWKKWKSSHFDRFSLSETGCSCITPMRSIGQSCAVSGTLFFSSPCLFHPPICQRFSVIFSCYFCLSFSGSLSISAKRHKNSSHKHFSNL